MWFKLDDGFATHPKLLAAGVPATTLQIRALCYCSQHQTDGFLAVSTIPLLTMGLDVDSDGEIRTKEDWPAFMIKCGLWELDNTGYKVHDYLEWNLSRSAIKVMRNKLSKAGKKGMKSRWNQENQDITKVITQVNNPVITSLSTSTLSLSSPKGEKIVKKRGNGAHPWSDELKPSEKCVRLASEWKLDLGFEWGKFKNYCLSHGKRYVDYEATFRNWLASAYERKEQARGLRKM